MLRGGDSLDATLGQAAVTIGGGTAPPTAPAQPAGRPPVTLQAQRIGDGRLRVTLTSGCAVIRSVAIGVDGRVVSNASVDVVDGPAGITAARSIAPASPSQTVVLVISRLAPGQATTVPLTVTDDCGPWHTFVGGGPSAS